MALIQINVSDDIKAKADAAFSRSGITTPMAMKMMVTQVAVDGKTPFDGLFSGGNNALSEKIYRDMIRVEAQELGLIPDDSVIYDGIPNEVFDDLGIDRKEVLQ